MGLFTDGASHGSLVNLMPSGSTMEPASLRQAPLSPGFSLEPSSNTTPSQDAVTNWCSGCDVDSMPRTILLSLTEARQGSTDTTSSRDRRCDAVPSPTSTESEETVEQRKSRRGRYAANRRRARSRALQVQVKGEELDSPDSDPNVEDSQLERRRQKNRNAAARCRAKAKNRESELRIKFGRESARHDYLKRQLLELRDSLTYLRNCALQHDSSGCKCDTLHKYNDAQAQNVRRSFSSTGSLSVSVGG
jgi:hypothetical protein